MDNKLKIQQKELLARQGALETEIRELKATIRKKVDELAEIEKKSRALYAVYKPRDITVKEYHVNLPWKMKICYVLTQLKALTISEIINLLSQVDENIDKTTAYQTVQKTLYRLIEELKVVKIGKYNSKYKLNI